MVGSTSSLRIALQEEVVEILLHCECSNSYPVDSLGCVIKAVVEDVYPIHNVFDAQELIRNLKNMLLGLTNILRNHFDVHHRQRLNSMVAARSSTLLTTDEMLFVTREIIKEQNEVTFAPGDYLIASFVCVFGEEWINKFRDILERSGIPHAASPHVPWFSCLRHGIERQWCIEGLPIGAASCAFRCTAVWTFLPHLIPVVTDRFQALLSLWLPLLEDVTVVHHKSPSGRLAGDGVCVLVEPKKFVPEDVSAWGSLKFPYKLVISAQDECTSSFRGSNFLPVALDDTDTHRLCSVVAHRMLCRDELAPKAYRSMMERTSFLLGRNTSDEVYNLLWKNCNSKCDLEKIRSREASDGLDRARSRAELDRLKAQQDIFAPVAEICALFFNLGQEMHMSLQIEFVRDIMVVASRACHEHIHQLSHRCLAQKSLTSQPVMDIALHIRTLTNANDGMTVVKSYDPISLAAFVATQLIAHFASSSCMADVLFSVWKLASRIPTPANDHLLQLVAKIMDVFELDKTTLILEEVLHQRILRLSSLLHGAIELLQPREMVSLHGAADVIPPHGMADVNEFIGRREDVTVLVRLASLVKLRRQWTSRRECYRLEVQQFSYGALRWLLSRGSELLDGNGLKTSLSALSSMWAYFERVLDESCATDAECIIQISRHVQSICAALNLAATALLRDLLPRTVTGGEVIDAHKAVVSRGTVQRLVSAKNRMTQLCEELGLWRLPPLVAVDDLANLMDSKSC